MAIRERDRLFHLQGLYPDNPQLVRLYNDKATFVKSTNERLRAEFYANKIENASGDARKIWKVYKEIVFNKHQEKQDFTISINGTPTTDSIDSCNAVNEHFCTAGEILATNIIAVHGYNLDDINDLYPEHSSNNWSFKEIDSATVSSSISKLPNKKSTGIDNVPINLIKSASNVLAPLIALCFNIAIWSSVYPYELLKGRLKLIHKSGDTDIENFRGITLLPALSKVFEYILYEQLITYLDSINFFIGSQYGFLRNSSCIGAVHQLVDFIKDNFRKKHGSRKMYVACIFVDLKRAFDTVDSKRLERKINRIGLSQRASNLILSYIECRQTATQISNSTSIFKRILVGVAQGSIIGPLLFIIYMNDILQLDFLGKILLYADDTVLYYAAD